MGASGAGKTSLLNILAGQTDGGLVDGKVFIDGREIKGNDMSKECGFVFQDDVILSTMVSDLKGTAPLCPI